MCYAKPGPRCSYHATQRLHSAKEVYKSHPSEKNKAKVRAATVEYLMSPRGIAQLHASGEHELAAAAEKERESKIAAYEAQNPGEAPSLVIMQGISGSGKSTWARAWVALKPKSRVRVNRDEIRTELFGTDVNYSPEQEGQVDALEAQRVGAALREKKEVVVDATHVSTRRLESMESIGCASGAAVSVQRMELDPAVAKERIAARAAAGGLMVGDEIVNTQVTSLARMDKEQADALAL